MYTFEEVQKLVKEYINNLDFVKEPERLYQPIQYTLESGGKRVRPSLVLMGRNLFADNIEAAYPLAGAVEVFHNFTLLHDDIMDKADMRRNQPTVHVKWDPNVAILSGDAMSIKAYELLAEYKGERFREILKLFNRTALQICEGQQMDMDFEEMEIVPETEYLKMIELKTSVLLSSSLMLGALTTDAKKEDLDNLYAFGRFLGLSFQLQDDYLDLYGDPKVFGKKIGGDIVANKKTYLYIKTIEVANETDIKALDELMRANDIEPDIKISNVRDLFDKHNVAELTREKMEHYDNLAHQHLEKMNIADDRKKPLRNLAEVLLKRNK